MAYQHFTIDTSKPHGLKLAKLMKDAEAVVKTAASLKAVADEVTAGGTTLTAAAFLDLFGLPSADAGTACYPMLQSLTGGTISPATIAEFDQGMP